VEVPVKVPEALHWVGAYPSALEQMLFFSWLQGAPQLWKNQWGMGSGVGRDG
jgi:hypothetical protein